MYIFNESLCVTVMGFMYREMSLLPSLLPSNLSLTVSTCPPPLPLQQTVKCSTPRISPTLPPSLNSTARRLPNLSLKINQFIAFLGRHYLHFINSCFSLSFSFFLSFPFFSFISLFLPFLYYLKYTPFLLLSPAPTPS